jgi:hypothetical protein
LNTDAVLNPTPNVTTIYIDQETLFTETGQTWTYSLSDLGNLYNLRAMLVWTDAPGAGLGGETEAWVNDLDFTLTVDSDTYYGNNFGVNGLSTTGGSPDGINNTEGIFLNSQSTSSITFTISAANIAGDGVPNNGDDTDQDFALVIYITRLDTVYRLPIFFQ